MNQQQLSIFAPAPLAPSVPPPAPRFGGKTYDPARDGIRMSRQLAAVHRLMSDGQWWSLLELAGEAGKLTGKRVSESAASARIRDLRKDQFGGRTVEARNAGGGLWLYRLVR